MRWKDITEGSQDWDSMDTDEYNEAANDVVQRDLVNPVAQMIKKEFEAIYPDTPIRVWVEDDFWFASTDPDSDNTKGFAFDDEEMSDNWTAEGTVSAQETPEGTRVLELCITDASAGEFKGVWSRIIGQWAAMAKPLLAKYGASKAGLNADIDYSGGAWEALAQKYGLINVDNQGEY